MYFSEDKIFGRKYNNKINIPNKDFDKTVGKNKKSGSTLGNLPSARAGHPYRMQISRDLFQSNLKAIDSLEGLEKTGLHFFPDKKQITGVPKKSGSFDLLFNIREYNESGKEQMSTHTLKLIVEEDYNFPLDEVDESDPYWKPDEDVCAVPVNKDGKTRLKKDMVAASMRGFRQIEKGKIREDDFNIQYDPKTRWYALAVSDGAGKSKFSRKGSEIACDSAVKSILDRLKAQSKSLKKLTIKYSRRKSEHVRKEIIGRLHDVIARSATDAYSNIVDEAARQKHEPADFATTLLLCICKKFEFGWLIGAFGVGDGAICAYQKNKWYANLMGGMESPPEKYFLTTPGIIQPSELERRICFTIIDDFSALFLMTNGVSNPKFGCASDMPCFELWDKFWDELNSQVDFSGKINDVGEELLKWLGFWTPGKNDDRTIAVLF